MTHNLTQNRKTTVGTDGLESARKHTLLDIIGSESTRNIYFAPLRAATDQKAGDSNPLRRTKIPVKSCDFTGILFDFCTFLAGSFLHTSF